MAHATPSRPAQTRREVVDGDGQGGLSQSMLSLRFQDIDAKMFALGKFLKIKNTNRNFSVYMFSSFLPVSVKCPDQHPGRFWGWSGKYSTCSWLSFFRSEDKHQSQLPVQALGSSSHPKRLSGERVALLCTDRWDRDERSSSRFKGRRRHPIRTSRRRRAANRMSSDARNVVLSREIGVLSSATT